MIDITNFLAQIQSTKLANFTKPLKDATEAIFNTYTHGELQNWYDAIKALPHIDNLNIITDEDAFTINTDTKLPDLFLEQLSDTLKLLHPWRKGPFNLFGIDIDCEWRSNLKWERVLQHIQPLENKLILDVGCSNGYYCWRMLDQNPQLILGIDPSQKFMMQFQLFKQYASEQPVYFLPLKSEELPTNMAAFDTVFSMGILYHRKSPFDHLEELKSFLAPNGELVLETLVIDGGINQVLVPGARYAQMRNVWFIPSPETLVSWAKKVGFKDVRIVDINQTSINEQRSTPWMHFNSLTDFLDSNNPNLTIEGYPAPRRALLIARK